MRSLQRYRYNGHKEKLQIIIDWCLPNLQLQ